jgi:hypothetical protein
MTDAEIQEVGEEAITWCKLRYEQRLRSMEFHTCISMCSLVECIEYIMAHRAGVGHEDRKKYFHEAVGLILRPGSAKSIPGLISNLFRPQKSTHRRQQVMSKDECQKARASITRFLTLVGAEYGYEVRHLRYKRGTK